MVGLNAGVYTGWDLPQSVTWSGQSTGVHIHRHPSSRHLRPCKISGRTSAQDCCQTVRTGHPGALVLLI